MEGSFPTPLQAEKQSALWRNRNYVLLWSGQLVSMLGSAASGIVFSFLIFAITNLSTAAAIAAAPFILPYVSFRLSAGASVDPWDCERVMTWCDIGWAALFARIRWR